MEYKGELKGFPTEVVEKMLERQVEQGNRRDVSAFEKNRMMCIGGFAWASSPEGHSFWEDVIKFKNFDTFFAKYPKNTYPKVMMVSQSPILYGGYYKRVVFMEKNGKYLAWRCAETIFDSRNETEVTTWNYAEDIKQEPEPIELTIDEIAEKFGITPEQVKIKK
jgi:hypothetical protein